MTFKNIMSAGLTTVMVLALAGCVLTEPRKTQTPENDAVKAQVNLAAALLKEGAVNQALPELLKAQKMDPKNANVENLLGLTYYSMKEYDLAITSYHNALKFDPKRTDVHNNIGLVYLAQQKYDQALQEFNLCLKDLVYQKKHLPLSNIGLTYMQMGNYDEALASLTRATEVAPDYAKSYHHIGQIYKIREQYNEAADYLGNAARLSPGDAEIQMDLGDVYAKQNKMEEAATAYSQAAALAPNTPLALEAQKRARKAMGFD